MPTSLPDRHTPQSKQYNVRVPVSLLQAFLQACWRRKLQPAAVMRTLMQGFVDVAGEPVAQKGDA